jgi:hypothetical protein
MSVTPGIRDVFGYFQNLNLLVLIQDLRDGRTARHTWSSGSELCPVAHGLADGSDVQELVVLGQASELDEGCLQAARHIGADPGAVLRFVRSWDEEALPPDRLLRELEELWRERLEDAQAMQEVLDEGTASPSPFQGIPHEIARQPA